MLSFVWNFCIPLHGKDMFDLMKLRYGCLECCFYRLPSIQAVAPESIVRRVFLVRLRSDAVVAVDGADGVVRQYLAAVSGVHCLSERLFVRSVCGGSGGGVGERRFLPVETIRQSGGGVLPTGEQCGVCCGGGSRVLGGVGCGVRRVLGVGVDVARIVQRGSGVAGALCVLSVDDSGAGGGVRTGADVLGVAGGGEPVAGVAGADGCVCVAGGVQRRDGRWGARPAGAVASCGVVGVHGVGGCRRVFGPAGLLACLGCRLFGLERVGVSAVAELSEGCLAEVGCGELFGGGGIAWRRVCVVSRGAVG